MGTQGGGQQFGWLFVGGAGIEKPESWVQKVMIKMNLILDFIIVTKVQIIYHKK